MSEQNNPANDYALALYLDKWAVAIFALVADYHGDLPDLGAINRSYVLLVNELQKLYKRNPELSSIKENICWTTFDTISRMNPGDLWEYDDDYRNHGNDHIAKVERLCITADKLVADITPGLQKILDEAKENVNAFAENWLIPEYTFAITADGTLLVNDIVGVMRVKKVQAGSTTETILVQAQARINETFQPNLGMSRIERGIRTSLIEVGFTGAIEKLFLPVMDNQRGIKFRPKVTRSEANKERIDLTDLDARLKSLGAETVFSKYGFPK